MSRRNWDQDELLLALRLYFETPFGKLHRHNPEIIALAERLDRTPSALAMKLSNLASLDPAIRSSGRSGLSGASAADRAAWEAFTGDWTAAVARTDELDDQNKRRGMPANTERKSLQRQRIGQDFFRRAVLSNFDERCCASNLGEPRLLVASHVVPWADDIHHRLNPANGLCLAATYDRAFDAGLMTVDDEFKWRVSRPLLASKDDATRALFRSLDGAPVRAPSKVALSKELLSRHRQQSFARHEFG